MSYSDYVQAAKIGKKDYQSKLMAGESPTLEVLDDILHIYIKNDDVTRFISICCLGLCTENNITSFKLRNTTLKDADMDKIY